MDSIADLLNRHRRDEPPEIRLIKDYVRQHFSEDVGVLIRERDIVITVRSSALAGAMRMHIHILSGLLDAKPAKRLVLRVGNAG